VFAGADIRIIRTPVRAPRERDHRALDWHAAPRMPRPPADHRTASPRGRAARVRRAIQHPPSAPVTRSAPARRPHSPALRGDRPTATTRPARRSSPRVSGGHMT
jgi:hypothetical protein